jgi:hypothetical protein
MGFETVNAFWHPAMFERLVKLRRSLLQLHTRLPAVRRLSPPADEAVNFLLNIDEQLFHNKLRLNCGQKQSKRLKRMGDAEQPVKNLFLLAVPPLRDESTQTSPPEKN